MAEAKPTSPPHKGRIRDARGRPATQLDPVSMHILRRYELIDREALRAIAEEIGPGRSKAATWWFWLLEGLTILCMVAVTARVYFSGRARDPTTYSLWGATFVLVVIGISIFISVAKRQRFHRVRDAMLRHRRCPHCGYDLRGLPADSTDGATVCPECGCAWHVKERVDG